MSSNIIDQLNAVEAYQKLEHDTFYVAVQSETAPGDTEGETITTIRKMVFIIIDIDDRPRPFALTTVLSTHRCSPYTGRPVTDHYGLMPIPYEEFLEVIQSRKVCKISNIDYKYIVQEG